MLTHIKCEAHQLRHTENSYVHTDAFMQTHTTLLHTELFTQGRSYTHTHMFFQTKHFRHKTTHTIFYTQVVANTQNLLHTGTFTHRRWDTQALARCAFTHSCLYTQIQKKL